MDPAQMMQRLDEALKLTDAQKAQIADISKKQADQVRALRGKIQDLQNAAHDQIRALLTIDQQKKFDAMPRPGPGRPPPNPGGPRGPEGPAGAGTPPPAPPPAPPM
jgi:hypothetical protein